MCRLIIAGSRSVTDQKRCIDIIDVMIERLSIDVAEVVSGGAAGPDRHGEEWARLNGVSVKQFIPDWSMGKRAGMVRNKDMGDYATHLIAIWDGQSRGTKQMIDYMKSLKKPYGIYFYHSKDVVCSETFKQMPLFKFLS